uniref:NusB/RsmB/TIM44 domain-containing protein n=1 Tax=Kalanchoe fedtschenkoi TaxID=63787 RepID=A0A7N0UMU4_KALFE
MEAASILSSPASRSPDFRFHVTLISRPVSSHCRLRFPRPFLRNSSCLRSEKDRALLVRRAVEASSSSVIAEEVVETGNAPRDRDAFPKVDKTGRFCSPRAARELALSMVYASCLEGSDPVRLFDKRVNARREPGYEFDKNSLLKYYHMSFGGAPVTAETVEEADEFLRIDEMESAIEAEVLSAPPKLVYSKLILRFTRKLLVAIVEKWDAHVLIIDKVAPANWKNEPASRILELCILHLAMSEIGVLGTRHQIVINEVRASYFSIYISV